MNKLVLLKSIGNSNKERIKVFFNNIIKNNTFMNNIIILTTAITRPELHTISFTNYAKHLPTDIIITWIINIDYVNFGIDDKNVAIQNTIDNIKNIFSKHNVNFKFTTNMNGNFNNAVRTVINNTINNISINTKYIMYLEDDWYIKNDLNLKKLINTNIDAIRLNGITNKPSISFQPSLLKPFVWYLLFYIELHKNKDVNIDPEKICQKKEDFFNKYNLSYKSKYIFIDIGRDYMNNNTNMVRGWFQKNDNNISMSYINIDTLLKSFSYMVKIKNKNLQINLFVNNILEEINNFFIKSLCKNICDTFYLKKETYYNFYNMVNVSMNENDMNKIYIICSETNHMTNHETDYETDSNSNNIGA